MCHSVKGYIYFAVFHPANISIIDVAKSGSGALKRGLDNIYRLSEIYETGSIMETRQVIGSVYPEKPTFDDDQLRTTRINETVKLIYALDKEMAEKKQDKVERFHFCPVKSGRQDCLRCCAAPVI